MGRNSLAVTARPAAASRQSAALPSVLPPGVAACRMRGPPGAGWSSLAARRAHNPKVAGSNPAPATTYRKSAAFGRYLQSSRRRAPASLHRRSWVDPTRQEAVSTRPSLHFKITLKGLNRRKERVSIVIHAGFLDDDRSRLPFQEIVGLETRAFHD